MPALSTRDIQSRSTSSSSQSTPDSQLTSSAALEVTTDAPQLPATPRTFTFPISHNLADSPYSSPSNSPFEPDHLRSFPTQWRDKDYIKRPENAYILFRRQCCEDRQQLLDGESATGGAATKKRRHADLSKTISQQWNSLSAAERKIWEDKSALKKREHEQLHPGYVYRPQRAKDKDGRTSNKKNSPASAAPPNQPRAAKTWVQDPDDGQWKSTSSTADYFQQKGVPFQEMERVVLGSHEHLSSTARPGRESAAPAGMFTNAHINAIHGGAFVNVAQFHGSDSGGGPAFPIMVLGLQAVFFATRSQYPHCNHPVDAPFLVMQGPTSTSSLMVYPPVLYQEMRIAIAPLVLWILIKTWVQRWSI